MELTEELCADDLVLLHEPEAEADPSSTMEIAAADILFASVVEPVAISSSPTLSPAPIVSQATKTREPSGPVVSIGSAGDTRSCAPQSVAFADAPASSPSSTGASGPAPLSASTLSVAALMHDEEIDLLPRRSPWWRYTLASAGVSALLCCVGFAFAGEPAPVEAAPREAEARVIAYDPAVLDEADEAAVGDPGEGDEVAPILARRIALRGTRNLEAGRIRLAREAFEKALGHDPECRPALAGLGQIHFEAGHSRKAVEYLAPAVRIEPRDGDMQRMLAAAYRAIGHDKSAARHQRLATRHGG